jgi:hypothetical protein
MSVRSAAPARSGLVYSLLIAAGLIAGLIGAATVIYISYEYVTREELRNPVPHEESSHGSLPTGVV